MSDERPPHVETVERLDAALERAFGSAATTQAVLLKLAFDPETAWAWAVALALRGYPGREADDPEVVTNAEGIMLGIAVGGELDREEADDE